MIPNILQLNYTLFQDINGHAGQHPLLDMFMIFCANWLIFFWPLLLLMAWGRPLNWRQKTLQTQEADIVQKIRATVLWIGVACVIAYIINLGLEHIVFEPRPFISHHVHLLVTHPADASFPSDHSAWSFAVVGMFLFTFLPLLVAAWKKRMGGWRSSGLAVLFTPLLFVLGAFVIACSIGVARVFVGIHYPGDILGGALDGLVAAFLVTLIRQWFQRPTYALLQFAHKLHVA